MVFVVFSVMAEDLDVEAMLEAPYREKVGVGTHCDLYKLFC